MWLRLDIGSITNNAAKSVKATIGGITGSGTSTARKVADVRIVITQAMGRSIVSQLHLLRLTR